MKISLVTTSFPRDTDDEAGIFIARIVAALDEQGVSGVVVAPWDCGARIHDRFGNWQVRRVKYGILAHGNLAYGLGIMPNLRKNPLLFFQVPGLLCALGLKLFKEARDSEIVHAHWLASAVPAIVVANLLKKPLVITVRGEDLKLLTLPILGPILKLIFRGKTEITSISESFVQRLQQIFPGKKIHFIPNGVSRSELHNLAEVKAKYGLNASNYSIFASRVIPLKRVQDLVALLSKLDNQHLVVCGSLEDRAYVDSLKQQAASSGVEDRLHFLGAVAPTDYSVLLAGASLYWSASEYEGRPNSVLEALACAVPVIASNIAAHASLIQDGVNGYLFQSPDEIVGKVELLLKDRALHQNMARNAVASVAHLSWERCAKEYKELYLNCLK